MPMSTQPRHHNERIAVSQDADHADLVDAINALTEEVTDLREENQQLRDRVEALEADQEQTAEDLEGQAKADAKDRQRITDLEERLDDVEDRLTSPEPHPSDTEDSHAEASTTPQTPLEQTVAMPEEMVESETANVRRAVFVARDVEDYTTSCPAGRVIRSSELRRVLAAGTDCRGHSQTVDRVMAVLEDLGGEDVKIVDRRGERRVVFDDDLTERLGQLTSDEEPSHDVVTEEAV